MRQIKKSLIVSLGTVVLLVEFFALTSLGLFYTERFSAELDKTLEDSINLPAKLMNRQLLRYESVTDRSVMTELVGEEFLDGMVLGGDGRVYYAYDQTLVGTPFTDLPEADDIVLDTAETTPRLIHVSGEHSIISITPLVAYAGAKPFFHVYIKADTQAVQTRKRRIAMLFIFGSAICIVLTSLAIISYSRRQVTSPLRELRESAEALSRGEYDVDIPEGRNDEIGSLANSFRSMRNAIVGQISQLELTNADLEDKERKITALISAFPDRILIFDWKGTFLDVYAADQYESLLKARDMEGKQLHDVHPKHLADLALNAIRETIATGESQEVEYYLEGTEGLVWFEGRTSRIGDESGEQGMVIWVARDITYRKEMEERLTRAKEDAEKINMRLLELDQTKSTLVSSVSHELRTPLTSLLGFSKLILKNFATHFWPLAKGDHALLTKGAQIIENLNILIHEGNRLTRLINDVLDLNKIEMGHTDWREERIAPVDLVHKAARAVSGQFDDNPQLSLAVEVDDNLPEIVVDNDRMLQVLLNLLTNAAKFTPSGLVTLRATSPATGILRLEIADTGPGIPQEEQERIFDVFHQAGDLGPSDDKPHGAGLGLAICRDIVNHYEGTIWVESEVGQGATFIVELPV